MILKRSKIFASIVILIFILFSHFEKCFAKNNLRSYISSEKMASASNKVKTEGDKELEDTIKEINRYTLSDSLWKIWRAVEDSQFVVNKSDSVESIKLFYRGAKLAKEAFDLLSNLKNADLDSLSIRKGKIQAILALEKARTYFEKTFKLNPFDIKTQNYLIWIFQSLAELYSNCENNIRAINMLEYLTYILQDDQNIFYKLGIEYYNIGRWDKSLSNIKKSINIILDDDWNKIDNKELFEMYYLRANAEIQLELTDDALLSLNYAKIIAPTQLATVDVQKKIEWINWDNGNLETSRKSDLLSNKLVNISNDYSQIKEEYLDLLNQVKSIQAKRDITWKIAQLEFQFLNSKPIAIERIHDLIKDIGRDSTVFTNKIKLDKYLEDYSSMCYNLATDYLNKLQYKKAFIYYYQSIQYPWSGIGKSYLQLSNLSVIDNDATIQYAQKALQHSDKLTEQERFGLYQNIYDAFKRLGKFQDAKIWYQKLSNYTLEK